MARPPQTEAERMLAVAWRVFNEQRNNSLAEFVVPDGPDWEARPFQMNGRRAPVFPRREVTFERVGKRLRESDRKIRDIFAFADFKSNHGLSWPESCLLWSPDRSLAMVRILEANRFNASDFAMMKCPDGKWRVVRSRRVAQGKSVEPFWDRFNVPEFYEQPFYLDSVQP